VVYDKGEVIIIRGKKQMNVLQNLTELYNSQSTDSVYRDLSKQILEHLKDMKRVTIYDIAELTNTSRTTVWRLVQKLGYKSFSDFRYALQSAASQYNYYNRMVSSKKISSADALIQEVSKQLQDASNIYQESLSADLIEELTNELYSSSKIHFYMPFRLSFIYSFQQNLWKSGKDTAYFCLIPDMLNDIEMLDSDSIVIINTIEFAETLDMTEIFKRLKEKGAKIWFTGNAESQYADYVDRKLLTANSKPTSWILALECFILTLSERYRGKFIDS
jgi:DNA-binding MurR/RpiR family transcriptional regulator